MGFKKDGARSASKCKGYICDEVGVGPMLALLAEWEDGPRGRIPRQ